MEEKVCDKCNKSQSLVYFDKNTTGYRATCKKCRYERTKELREERKTFNQNKLSFKKNKKCVECDKTKPVSEFNRLSTNKDGLCSYCKVCYKKKRITINAPKQNEIVLQIKKCNTCLIEKPIADFKQTQKSNDGYFHKCKSCWKPTEWNKEKQKASEKKYVQNNPEKMKAKWKRAACNINRRIRDSLNGRITDALKAQRLNKSNKTFEYVGCSKDDLKRWFEYLFIDDMNWDNYGNWHIDHVIPCSSFDLSSDDELKRCFNWKNLRPCWSSENLEKSSKIIPELIERQNRKVNEFLNNPLPSQPGDRVDGTE